MRKIVLCHEPNLAPLKKTYEIANMSIKDESPNNNPKP